MYRALLDEKQMQQRTEKIFQLSSGIMEWMMIWACFAAKGLGRNKVFDLTMNFPIYQSILQSNVKPSVYQLKLGHAPGQ